MATRSIVGYEESNGYIKAVYVHWDGNPDTRIPILTNLIKKGQIKDVINGGDMSSIEDDISDCQYYEDGKVSTYYSLGLLKNDNKYMDYYYIVDEKGGISVYRNKRLS